MSRFDNVKEKISDIAETVDARTEEVVERGKSEFHEFKAEQADKRAEDIHNGPDRRDKLKQ